MNGPLRAASILALLAACTETASQPPAPAKASEPPPIVEALLPELPPREVLYAGSSSDPGQLAHDYLALAEPALDADALRATARRLRRGTRTRHERILAASKWMHGRLRQRPAVEGAPPRPPTAILKSGVADEEELATVLVSLLRAMGIPANVALVRSVGREDAPPLFDHALVHLRGRRPVFIDPTLRGVPPGELRASATDRHVLLVDSKRASWAKTPRPVGRLVVREEIVVTGDEKSELRTKLELVGFPQSPLRRDAMERTPRKRRADVAAYVRQAHGSTDFEYRPGDPLDPAAPFEEQLLIRNPSWALQREGALHLPLRIEPLLEALPPILRVRDPDAPFGEEAKIVRLPTELEMDVRVMLHPLLEWRGDRLRHSDEAGGISWSWEQLKRPDGPEIRIRLAVPGGELDDPVAARKSLAFLFELIEEGIEAHDRIDRLVSAGMVSLASKELDSMQRARPKDARLLGARARIALAAGLGAEARRQAEAAAALEPRSAELWSLLGKVRSHDEFGHAFAPGLDRKGAIVALVRARKLDPTHRPTRARLASLYVRGDNGIVGAKGADFERALEELKALDPSVHPDHRELLLLSLYRLGRDEALAKHPARTHPLVVASLARVSGGEKALQRLVDQSAANRESILIEAVRALFSSRDYEAMRELLAHVQTMPNKEALRQVRRRDREEPRLDSARDVLAEAYAHALGATPRIPPRLLGRGLRGSLQGLRAGDEEALADAFHSLVEISLEEREGIGLLATIRHPFSGEFRELLQQTESGLRLHPVALPAHRLDEAFRALDTGDIAGARRWLELHLHLFDDSFLHPNASAVARWLERDEPGAALAIATEDRPWLPRLLPVLERIFDGLPTDSDLVEPLASARLRALSAAGRFDEALALADSLQREGSFSTPAELDLARRDVLRRAARAGALESLRKNASGQKREGLQQALLRGDRNAMRAILLAKDEGEPGDAVRTAIASVYAGVREEDVSRAEALLGDDQRQTLALLLAEKGEVNRALLLLGETDDPASPRALFARARIAEALGHPEAARELYARVESDPDPYADLHPLARARAAKFGR